MASYVVLAGHTFSPGGFTLRLIDVPGPPLRVEICQELSVARGAGGDLYRRIVEVKGRWREPPRFSVIGRWRLADLRQAPAFERNRRRLFRVRADCFNTFALDWLLRSLVDPARYLVLGMYGEERDLRLCRDHPEVQRYNSEHPPEATAVGGLNFYRFEA
jgi:hypothetical protein